MKNCKNCNTVFEGKYCNNCGQKASVGELTLKELFDETWHAFTHTDKGALRLLKDLIIHPGGVYLNYFSGQRKKYFNPFTFFLVSAAILIFAGIKIFDYEDYMVGTRNEFGRYILTETKFLSLLIVPIQILLTWIFFHRQFNLAKNIVFWLLLNGLVFSIKILVSPIYLIFISHKYFLDNLLSYISFIIIFIHLLILFGKRKWLNYLSCFFIVNVVMVITYVIQAYLIFDNDLLKGTHSKNILDLISQPYRW